MSNGILNMLTMVATSGCVLIFTWRKFEKIKIYLEFLNKSCNK